VRSRRALGQMLDGHPLEARGDVRPCGLLLGFAHGGALG